LPAVAGDKNGFDVLGSMMGNDLLRKRRYGKTNQDVNRC